MGEPPLSGWISQASRPSGGAESGATRSFANPESDVACGVNHGGRSGRAVRSRLDQPPEDPAHSGGSQASYPRAASRLPSSPARPVRARSMARSPVDSTHIRQAGAGQVSQLAPRPPLSSLRSGVRNFGRPSDEGAAGPAGTGWRSLRSPGPRARDWGTGACITSCSSRSVLRRIRGPGLEVTCTHVCMICVWPE